MKNADAAGGVAGNLEKAEKNLRIEKKYLQNTKLSYIMNHVVTLIAMKREVAARRRGFSVERMSS